MCRSSVALALAVAVVGCHRYPEPESLATYHQRDIDRPYTLPADVNTWFTLAAGGYLGPEEDEAIADSPDQPMDEAAGGEWVAPVPLPIGFEFSLGSRVTVEAFAVPLAVRAAIAESDAHTWGVRAGPSRILFSSSDGFVADVDVDLYHRWRLGRDIALVTTTGTSYTFRELATDTLGLAVEAGPLAQLSDDLSARPYARVGGRYRDGSYGLNLSVGGEAGYRLNRRWRVDVDVASGFRRLGFSRTAHVGLGRLVYFW